MVKQNGLFAMEGLTKSDRSIHTASGFARQNLLYVQEVGRLQSLKPHRCIREKLDSFLFMIVLEGEGNVVVADSKYELKKGNCAFIDCMEHYEHISGEDNSWKLAWVHFNGNVARGYYELFSKYNNGINVFAVEDTDKWNELIAELLEVQKKRDFMSELQTGEMLLHLLNCIISNVVDRSDMLYGTEKDMANEIREYLNKQYTDQDVIFNLQKTFDKEEDDLNECFLRYFGIDIREYLNNRRMNIAKELLRFSVDPIEEIAKKSGIGEEDIFQQMFIRSENMTAEEYRMKWAQWIR